MNNKIEVCEEKYLENAQLNPDVWTSSVHMQNDSLDFSSNDLSHESRTSPKYSVVVQLLDQVPIKEHETFINIHFFLVS